MMMKNPYLNRHLITSLALGGVGAGMALYSGSWEPLITLLLGIAAGALASEAVAGIQYRQLEALLEESLAVNEKTLELNSRLLLNEKAKRV